ncbi:MAG: ATP-binding protein [Planctomycetia bacterium]|nr:ATP-binding protein [Planctomycetia bacterium]
MDRINLQVAQDHVLSLTKLRKPIIAIEELIWNSLDADADLVEVTLCFNKAGGLDRIRVSDNGNGIQRDQCEVAFGHLGGSPKLTMQTTPKGRRPHGKLGRGRFKAFGIGREVLWTSRYEEDGHCYKFEIRGRKASICSFDVGDAIILKKGSHGVDVVISGIDSNFPSLANAEDAASELSRRLALYLNAYPRIVIKYDGQVVDPKALEEHVQSYAVQTKAASGEPVDGELTIIEWKCPVDRTLYLCDRHGFARDERNPGIQAPGFEFTAYFKSPVVERLDADNAFGLDDLNSELKDVIAVCKDALRTHFRKRESRRTEDLVKRWRQEEVYPYKEEPTDPLRKAEREVFDVCAFKVHEYLPNFDTTEQKSKQLTFRLIREALESNPTTLQTILREVLALPPEQQDELATLLDRTSLAAIINAANLVLNRLTFLVSLDSLLFGDFKKTLRERSQLHRILVDELWIFGEQYTIGVDDQSLKSLLAKHITLLGRDDIAPATGPVTDLDDRERIVDLMLYRRFPMGIPEQYEHLVIELKRPACVLGKKEIGQIRDYAFAVIDDERFDKRKTRWRFVLLGNNLDGYAEHECNVDSKEYGHIYSSKDGLVDIHVMRWSTVIDQAKWRYEFLRKELEARITTDDGLAYLRQKYPEYLP